MVLDRWPNNILRRYRTSGLLSRQCRAGHRFLERSVVAGPLSPYLDIQISRLDPPNSNDKNAFIAAAKTRQWDREKSVRTLA
jgi:hypothetical protein